MVQYELRIGGRSGERQGKRGKQSPDGEADQGSRGKKVGCKSFLARTRLGTE